VLRQIDSHFEEYLGTMGLGAPIVKGDSTAAAG
jgi:hypothetical protein